MINKSIEESIVLSIFDLANQLKKIGDDVYLKVGLTTQQWLILLHLSGNPNLPFFKREKHVKDLMASELAESLNVSRANITNLINVLLDKKLIKQFEDNEDRRKKRLRLTKKGIALIDKTQPSRLGVIHFLTEGFSSEEKDSFLRFLEQCTTKLVNEDEKIKSFHKLIDAEKA
ncbi:MarR family transcriptional regulator [Maribacter vaceletii]|uniref:MarR family transcriptional regulator n=1 Tax=Maribacter vaceletii TaxID=1206816 RepID=A0A495EE41_9FLAO|nr:MarR family transcriptional regulator [Maribacter vaceletii]RKR15190.1 MarR family transcriptional regulator [Maribacter vaceletii]